MNSSELWCNVIVSKNKQQKISRFQSKNIVIQFRYKYTRTKSTFANISKHDEKGLFKSILKDHTQFKAGKFFFSCKKEMLSKYVAWSLVCHIICIFVRKNKRIYLCYSNKTLRTCHFKWHDLDSNYFRKQTKLYFEIMFNCGMIFKPNFIAPHMTAKLNIVLKLWVIKFPIKLNCPRKCWLSSK